MAVATRKAYLVMKTRNNLIAVSELADTGCGIYFHMTGVEIDYEGEIITRGWHEKKNCLWRMPITSEGGDRITPGTNPREYDTSSGVVFSAEINAIYECKNQ